MQAEILFRVGAVVAGVFLLALAFISLVKKQMTEGIALGWAIGAVIAILLGAVPAFSEWSRRLSMASIAALLLFAVFVVGYMFKISSDLSRLKMKNQELAMQVSLLNQENERILNELSAMTGKTKVDI